MSDLLSLEQAPAGLGAALRNAGFEQFTACLLYTSDAADELT